jgi:Short C-terminal domain
LQISYSAPKPAGKATFKGVAMEYMVSNVTLQECLSRAEAYMVGEGHGIQNRTETSITFEWKPKMGGGMQVVTLANAFLNPKTFGQDLTAWNTISGTGTLLATPAPPEGTRLTIGGPPALQKKLAKWIEGELLNWSTEPLMKLQGGKKELLIFEDRTEVYEGFSEPRKLHRITAEQLKQVTLHTGWVFSELSVRSRDGETVTVGHLDQKKAKKAKEAIENQVPKPAAQEPPQPQFRKEAPLRSSATPDSKNNTEAADVPHLIRQLAELRDAGLLSNEEFEVKKTELLKRL